MLNVSLHDNKKSSGKLYRKFTNFHALENSLKVLISDILCDNIKIYFHQKLV